MLFTEFAEKLDFDKDIDRANNNGVKAFPIVSNVGKKIRANLWSTVNTLFKEKENRQRVLEICSLKYFPDDLSYCLMDDISVITNEDGKIEVHWFSQMEGENVDIAVFQLITKEVSLCDTNIIFVERAEFCRGLNDDIVEAVLIVLEKQQESGKSLFERWCQASDEWRKNHLICPNCGEPIDPYYRSNDLMKAECNLCGWESTIKYYYRSEFANIQTMQVELKKYKKKMHRNEIHDKLFQEMMEKVNAFIVAAANESTKEEAFYRYCNSMQKTIEVLTEADAQMKAIKEKKR